MNFNFIMKNIRTSGKNSRNIGGKSVNTLPGSLIKIFVAVNIKAILVIGGLLCFPLTVVSQDTTDYNVTWNHGFKFSGQNNDFNLKFGGRIMNDWGWFSKDDGVQDSIGDLSGGTEFRRARLFNSGTIYSNIRYKLQLDFAGGEAEAKDIFIEVTKIPFAGNIKVGHFKEPFGLETQTSSKYISFMERSFATVYAPSRNTGLMLHNTYLQSRLSWQLGWFKNADDFGSYTSLNPDEGNSLTARIAGLPFKNNENNRLLHLGLGYSYRGKMDEPYNISARPEAHLAEKYVTTGDIKDPNKVSLFNTELAFVSGPFALQGELFRSSVAVNSESYALDGGYAQISYVVTGEDKAYKNPAGGFGRLSPENNFSSKEKGAGALELALRYSTIDLSERNGGKMNGITGGISWYLNPSVRIMANYGRIDLKAKGSTDILQMRFQLDF